MMYDGICIALIYILIAMTEKYTTESALQNHYLNSILPHQNIRNTPQFIKNKDFYQPDKFIWNNPHRTSNQMYKFYHFYNDKFSQSKAIILKKLEQDDRNAKERQRIMRINDNRSLIRDKFLTKQKSREQLEAKCHLLTIDRHKTIESNLPATRMPKYLSRQGTETNSKPTETDIFSERIARINNTYADGVKKYDMKQTLVQKLIADQTADYHQSVRKNFHSRKNTNANTHLASHGRRISQQK